MCQALSGNRREKDTVKGHTNKYGDGCEIKIGGKDAPKAMERPLHKVGWTPDRDWGSWRLFHGDLVDGRACKGQRR